MLAVVKVDRLFATIIDSRILITGSLLAGVLLLGAIVIAYIRRQYRDEQPKPVDAGDELSKYRALYERGEISEEEFKNLRAVLAGEIRKSSGLPAKPHPELAVEDPNNPKTDNPEQQSPPSG